MRKVRKYKCVVMIKCEAGEYLFTNMCIANTKHFKIQVYLVIFATLLAG